LEYQAKLHGLNVKYVDSAYTSKTVRCVKVGWIQARMGVNLEDV